jgi:hypothetical protein
VLLIHLVASRTEFIRVVSSAAWMGTVVMTDGCMTVEAERDRVVDVRTVRVEMSDFDSDPYRTAAQATMPGAPQQYAQLVLFLGVVLASRH